MKPKIIEKDRLFLTGFSFYGDPFQFAGDWSEDNEIGRVWKRFGNYALNHKKELTYLKNKNTSYEVHIYNQETQTKGHFEVFVGCEIENINDVPVDLLIKILPPAKYAVFTIRGKSIVSSDWHKKMYSEWIPNAGLSRTHTYNIQIYDKRFKGMDRINESEIDIYIPVEIVK